MPRPAAQFGAAQFLEEAHGLGFAAMLDISALMVEVGLSVDEEPQAHEAVWGMLRDATIAPEFEWAREDVRDVLQIIVDRLGGPR